MESQTRSASQFQAERGRLTGLAARILGDPAEAEDIVQQAWLRLDGTDQRIDNLPGWLTTVTVRLCLDRLKAKVPDPAEPDDVEAGGSDPADDAVLADTVAAALNVVLDRMSPNERVAFVLHDSFGFEFDAISQLLGTSAAAARKLASRARAKVRRPAAGDALADWEVVDAFLDAARNGEFERLIELLAPDALVAGDAAAIALGTPDRIDGRDAVAGFFNGAASAALSVFVGDRPAAAWFDRGTPRVLFDFTVAGGRVTRIDFRADPDLLTQITRRTGASHSIRPTRHRGVSSSNQGD